MVAFRHRECSDEQIAAFWTWFESHEAKHTEKDGAKRIHALREAQEQLRVLFPACPESVGLTIMPSGDRWELNMAYGGKANARRIACRIRVMMPSTLQGKWRMELSE